MTMSLSWRILQHPHGRLGNFPVPRPSQGTLLIEGVFADALWLFSESFGPREKTKCCKTRFG